MSQKTAKLKAVFKCELFVKQFAPPAKKAKKSTKKVENKVDVKTVEKKAKKTIPDFYTFNRSFLGMRIYKR